VHKITIVAVGKMKQGRASVTGLIEDYQKRLSAYCKLSLTELPDEPLTSTRTIDQVRESEADRIRPFVQNARFVIALSEFGASLNSVEFARQLNDKVLNPLNGGASRHPTGPIIILVGGVEGIAPSLLKEADWILALSPMTFPHQLARLLILEQLYRAFKILRQEPYHR
jgi:23S rRNA (pseudouridine1915-N3)-methyltransferase